MARHNIAQVEFFHEGANASSLEDLQERLAQRMCSGSPIKTVVRFPDVGDCLFRIAQRTERLHDERESMVSRISDVKKFLRTALDGQFQRIAGGRAQLREEAKESVVRLLKATPIADIQIEQRDRSFRLLRSDEHHELLEAVSRPVDVWIFIFDPDCTKVQKRFM